MATSRKTPSKSKKSSKENEPDRQDADRPEITDADHTETPSPDEALTAKSTDEQKSVSDDATDDASEKADDPEFTSSTTDVESLEQEDVPLDEAEKSIDIGSEETSTPDTDTDTDTDDPVTDSTTQEDSPEPADTTATVTEPQIQGGAGFLPLLLGGVAAGLIGFAIARYVMPPAIDPAVIEALQARLDAQGDTQNASVDAIRDQMAQQQADLSQQIEALTAQLNERPEPDASVLPDDLRATLEAQKAEIETLQGELNAMAAFAKDQIAAAEEEQQSAERAQARAAARGALNVVREALQSGEPFSQVLPTVAQAVDVPSALESAGNSGVASEPDLQASFAQAARAALSASLRAEAGNETADRLRLFLQDQLGARSLVPKEGDDPDSVLSRAEAALKAGNIDETLREIDALPPAGQAELSDWAAKARTRTDAVAAYDALSATLSEN